MNGEERGRVFFPLVPDPLRRALACRGLDFNQDKWPEVVSPPEIPTSLCVVGRRKTRDTPDRVGRSG